MQPDVAALGKLDGVSEKIDQRLAYLPLVRLNIRHGFAIDKHFESQRFRLCPQAEHPAEIVQQPGEAECRWIELRAAGFDLGHVQNIVYEG